MGCCNSKNEEIHEFQNRPQSGMAERRILESNDEILPLPTVESHCSRKSWDFSEIDSSTLRQ